VTTATSTQDTTTTSLGSSSRRTAGIMLAGGALALAAGCASNRGGVRQQAAPVYIERPVEQLYNAARDALARRNYTEAVAGFEEVDRQHPYSEWARRALLMSAYAQYMQNKYEEAIASCQRFIGLYPGNPSTPYAYYLIAQSYFEQIVDVGRDQRMTELALAALNEVVQRYPASEYARDARLKMDMCRDQLAGKEMEIGRFYLRQDQHLAAIGRFRRVIDFYQTTSHVPEAMHRLVEGWLSIGVVDEATRVGSVLGYNYPGSEWYEASYKLLTDRGITPEAGAPTAEQRSTWLRRVLNPGINVTPASTRGTAPPPEAVGGRSTDVPPPPGTQPATAPQDPAPQPSAQPRRRGWLERLFRRD
jgi:outer membrane protein assembly factor BamD